MVLDCHAVRNDQRMQLHAVLQRIAVDITERCTAELCGQRDIRCNILRESGDIRIFPVAVLREIILQTFIFLCIGFLCKGGQRVQGVCFRHRLQRAGESHADRSGKCSRFQLIQCIIVLSVEICS